MKDPMIKKDHREAEYRYGDSGQIVLFTVFIIIWILDSFIFRYSTVLAKYIPVYIRIPISVAVFLFAVYMAKKSHHVVSDEVQDDPHIIKTGVYAYVRHPLYLSGLLVYESLIIFSISLVSFGFYLLIFLFYNYIASYEEKYLERKYGEVYLEYKRRVNKWIPDFSGNKNID